MAVLIKDHLKESAHQLAKIVGERAYSEARLLIAEALKISVEQVIVRADETLPADAAVLFQHLVARRLQYEPIAYLLGEKEFLEFKFKVSPAVLIPRPETESLVLETEKWILNRSDSVTTGPLRVIDLGTGSGCIILSLAKRLGAKIEAFAMEWSDEAMRLAKENAKALQVDCYFQKEDLLEPSTQKSFDVILSNPPYIPTSDLENLPLDIKNFEPIMALDGGEHGMRFYEGIVSQWWSRLQAGGLLALETYNHEQRERILELLKPLHTKSIWVVDCHLFIEKA